MNSKINYQLITDKIIEEIVKNNIKPKLLLHSCCAPCSSYVLEYLSQYFDITVLYYNPNIDTAEEFNHRVEEQERIIKELNIGSKFIASPYTSEEFYNAVSGLEHIREGGARCEKCFRLRLTKTAEYAKQNNFDYFTTTLSISPLKNSATLNSIGNELSLKYNVKYLRSDFKKRNGYKRSVELSKAFGMYRQDYCGCIFSKMERQVPIKY